MTTVRTGVHHAQMPPGALEGLLVADFSRVLAGPLCAMTLGDLGADVVKVERPGTGDDSRGWGPPYADDGTATYYLGLNRNKRSVVLDLNDSADAVLARRLAARADVVVDSFRPGLMARWGLDHDTLAHDNPGVISCSINAFGSGEEGAALPGYDLLLQAMSGLMSVTGEPGSDGRPLKVGAAVIDMLCGLYASTGILAALAQRTRTGRGEHVEVTLMDTALNALLNQASAFLNAGIVGTRMGNQHPSVAPYETFRASDGDVAVAVGNDAIFLRLCRALGRPEMGTHPDFTTNAARIANRDALGAHLRPLFATRPVGVLVAELTAAGVPAGPINDVEQAFALAGTLGLEPVDETDGVRTVRSPLRLSATPAAVTRRPPGLGEHDAEIRAWLGA
jgi:crotonobetainyl-CoA:carnitine CoA-transferase CaiB-like acyl-CoA transferase